MSTLYLFYFKLCFLGEILYLEITENGAQRLCIEKVNNKDFLDLAAASYVPSSMMISAVCPEWWLHLHTSTLWIIVIFSYIKSSIDVQF